MFTTLGMLKSGAGGGGGGTFPAIVSVTFTEDQTSPFIANMPATVAVGDLLILLVARGGGSSVPDAAPSGWTVLFGSGIGSYKWAAGTEGGTTVTQPMSGTSADLMFTVLRIQDADTGQNPQGSLGSLVSSSAPNPPALDPSWADANNLFIVFAGADDPMSVSAYPTGYTLNQQVNSGSTSAAAVAAKQSTSSASEDPAAWTLSSTLQCQAATIAVKGA